MKGLKLICSFWVAVGFVLFFLDSFPGVSTHVMYSNLPKRSVLRSSGCFRGMGS